MTQFKSGDKVNYTLQADMLGSMSGTITAVGLSVVGIIRDGNSKYDVVRMDLVSHQVKAQTPAEAMGLKVGDEVEITSHKEVRGLRGRVFLKRDDRSTSPRFVDEFGYEHYVTLSDVRKLPEGPKRGVKWSAAPAGATHYSLHDGHSNKWHKLDEAGKWSYASDDYSRSTRFVEYTMQHYARPESMVAIPGVVVTVNPMLDTLREVKALESDVRAKLSQIQTLERQVATLNLDKQAKLREIQEAGFGIVGGTLVQDLSKIPSTQWKKGDVVEALFDGLDIVKGRRYTVTGMDDFGDGAPRVCFRDDVNFPRRRLAVEYKLAIRK